jgi:hypothetical protein
VRRHDRYGEAKLRRVAQVSILRPGCSGTISCGERNILRTHIPKIRDVGHPHLRPSTSPRFIHPHQERVPQVSLFETWVQAGGPLITPNLQGAPFMTVSSS